MSTYYRTQHIVKRTLAQAASNYSRKGLECRVRTVASPHVPVVADKRQRWRYLTGCVTSQVPGADASCACDGEPPRSAGRARYSSPT